MPLIETADLRIRCLEEGVSEDPCIAMWPLDYDSAAQGSPEGTHRHGDHVKRLILLALALALSVTVACSETELRTIYEEPQLFDQPDALGPTIWTDQFQQRTVDASDMLFVIDDSGSMQDEQDELIANFQNFSENFVGTNLDYHIGVVRADLAAGTDNLAGWGVLEDLPDGTNWINPDTENMAPVFQEVANVGAAGAGQCEMGLQASMSALTYQTHPNMPNDGFYREDGLLSLVIISDEADHGPDLGGPMGMPPCGGVNPAEYTSWWLNSLKGPNDQDKLIFTAIVGPEGGCGSDDDGADEGVGYLEVVEAVDGNFLSVCEADWAEFLTELGLESAGLKTSFQLRRIPIDSTLYVTVDGVVPDASIWSYDPVKNSINFPIEHIPDELAMVEVTYQLAEDTGGYIPPDEPAE